jgi:predicted transcriptional regulator
MSIIMSPIELRSLKEILRESGVRQEDVAASIGITQEQLSRILNGNVKGRSKAVRTLSKKYAHKIMSSKVQAKCKSEITEAALALWDGDPSSADQVIAFLSSAKYFRGK